MQVILPQWERQALQPHQEEKFSCAHKENTADLPNLQIEKVLNSRKEKQATDVTLVTQLSFERLVMCGALSNACYSVAFGM